MTHELLLEIGTEELPAGFISDAMAQMKRTISDLLSKKRLPFETVSTAGTPRRLTLVVSGLAGRQNDIVKELVGPPKRVAFDDQGQPKPAAYGFAKTQGVDITALTTIETPRGEYVLVRKEERGESSQVVLQGVLPELLQALTFPKSMRWGSGSVSFARPVHWILAIYGGEVVPFHFGATVSGNLTYGHRFMAPQAIQVNGFSDYQDSLRKASVIVDPAERRSKISEEIARAAALAGGTPLKDEELLDTVTNLVEYPAAVCGSYAGEYLSLPRPVLITSMREHQKYFAVIDRQGELLPCFVAVNNTPVTNPDVVTKGHERVLRARLHDASFFFAEDLRTSLSALTEQLRGVIFHSRLGTSYEKVLRIKGLAVYLASVLNPHLLPDVERAAYLCKADLLTAMVREFPTLQGVMGKEYALLSGEKQAVADAILEHYRPAFAGDRLPEGNLGCILSIADKMDTITGCFGIGLAPSGTTDPYALRRQSLAILHIILACSLSISLSELIAQSADLLDTKMDADLHKIKEGVLLFFKTRYQNLLGGKFDADVIEAVTSLHFDNIPEVQGRIEALQTFKSLPEFQALSISFKRVVNISRDNQETNVRPELFTSPAEHGLYEGYCAVSEEVKGNVRTGNYLGALRDIAGLRASVDRLFDGVMVMDKDASLRQNRLNLLSAISDIFKTIADFSKLQS